MTNNNKKLWIHPGHFYHREKQGPLNRYERKLKAFICSAFSELLDIDPWMRSARLTPKGRRIVPEMLHRELGIHEPPLDMQDWAAVYPQLFAQATAYFHQWRPENSRARVVRRRRVARAA